MTAAIHSLRLAARSLHRWGGVAVVALAILALGVGLSVAVFTVADALLLRPLPVRDQARLVVLWGSAPDRPFNYPLELSQGREFARGARSLERAALFLYNGAAPLPVRDGDQVSRLRRALVSGEFFDVLGGRPLLGRALRRGDDVAGAEPVAVLSYRAWHERFNADHGVIGRRVVTYGEGIAYTIVGVMPEGLDYPRGTDFWAPVVPAMSPDVLSLMGFYVIGRLAPGASPASAGNELTTFLQRAGASVGQDHLHGVATSWPRLVIGDVRAALFAFAAAAGLLLLITCINVANLLAVRGVARVREVAVRSALGGTRPRIIRQLLTENSLLATAGGVLGVAVAAGAVRLFVTFAPPDVPRLGEIHLNTMALAGALAITAVTVLLFGLAPAILTSRLEPQAALRSDTGHSATRRPRIGTEALVAAQLALALLVLAAAGAITRSLINLQRADLSLDPSHLWIGELVLQSDLLASPEQQRAMLQQLLPQLAAIPGVRAISPVVAVPFSGAAGWDGQPAAEGQSPEEAAANPMLNMEVVAPGYFTTLGVPVLRGRGFTDRDREDAPGVVVVSQSAARHYWPGGDPLGKRLIIGDDPRRVVTVVGVVPDTRYRDLREARPSIYFPLDQSFFPFAPTSLAIRTDGHAPAPIAAIRRVIGRTGPGVALVSVASFGRFLEGPLAQPRMNALLLAVFAAAALAIATVGLFGVMAAMVRQRTRELGIRLALGAAPRDLQRMVMRRGLTVATAGVLAGLLGAFLANRLLVSLLYHVAPTDGVTLLAATAVLLGVASVATAIPARLSTRVDPLLALRAD
jgi:putative ABC transport system permease protein